MRRPHCFGSFPSAIWTLPSSLCFNSKPCSTVIEDPFQEKARELYLKAPKMGMFLKFSWKRVSFAPYVIHSVSRVHAVRRRTAILIITRVRWSSTMRLLNTFTGVRVNIIGYYVLSTSCDEYGMFDRKQSLYSNEWQAIRSSDQAIRPSKRAIQSNDRAIARWNFDTSALMQHMEGRRDPSE